MNISIIKTQLIELIEKDEAINSLIEKINEQKQNIKSEDGIVNIEEINKIRTENEKPVKNLNEFKIELCSLRTEKKEIEKILATEIDIDDKKFEIDLEEYGKYSIEKTPDIYDEDEATISYSKLSQ